MKDRIPARPHPIPRGSQETEARGLAIARRLDRCYPLPISRLCLGEEVGDEKEREGDPKAQISGTSSEVSTTCVNLSCTAGWVQSDSEHVTNLLRDCFPGLLK